MSLYCIILHNVVYSVCFPYLGFVDGGVFKKLWGRREPSLLWQPCIKEVASRVLQVREG